MSSEHEAAAEQREKEESACHSSPEKKKPFPFLVPSPVPTRRNRTISQSRLASEGPLRYGVCKEFCRNKGHGFIIPDSTDYLPSDGRKEIFVHISDIEGELVLKAGDRVSFKTISCPPKEKDLQAVDVIIINAKGPHETWTDY